MGTENKKTMSPLTAEQQEKVDRRRRLKWSIEKIARDLHVSEKRVSAYLKSKAVQPEATSAKKPKAGKKVADKKAAKADKKPCKCKKPTRGAQTCQKGLTEKDYWDQTIKEILNSLTSNYQDCVDGFIKEMSEIHKLIEKGIPARDMVEDAKQKCLKESLGIVRHFHPRIIVVKRVD